MKFIYRIGLMTVFFLASAPLALACSCFQVPNEDEVKNTDAVFTGKVIEITEDKSYVSPAPVANKPSMKIDGVAITLDTKQPVTKRFLVKFKVDKRFKGAGNGEITLVQYITDLAMCGEPVFIKDKKYLVYALNIKNELRSPGCTRTQIFDKKSEDYRELLKMRIKS